MKELRFHGKSLIMGKDALNYLERYKDKRVFVVTGGGSMIKNGTMDKIEKILKSVNSIMAVYKGIPANPTTADIQNGLEKLKEFKPHVLMGVGGGSAIDATKVMGIFYEYPELSFEKVLKEPLPSQRKELTFVAIPSTSGTGTEVTKFAVVTYEEKNLKIGLATDAFMPDVAILDPIITLSMPSNVVAETGMDAMTHALECYMNKRLDIITEPLARAAVEGLYKYLPQSYRKGDVESREKVHYYQSMAGSAFSNVGLGMAHGISHAFGGKFNMGHGFLNAIALPYVLKYNAQDKEVAEKLNYLGKLIGKSDLIKAIKELNEQLNIPESFKAAGISPDEFEGNFNELVKNSLKGSTRSNPVKISQEEMEKLLWYIYKG